MSIDAIKSCAPNPPQDITETVTLRRATLADAPALALTGAATFLEAYTWMLPGPDIVAHALQNHSTDYYAHALADPTTRVTLAVTGSPSVFPGEPGSVVGYAMVCSPELPSIEVLPTDIELKRIYLFSRFRRVPVLDAHGQPLADQRPGQALMDAAVADARSLGASRLLLGTHDMNLHAIAFYRRNGFSEVGTRIFHVGTQQCRDLIFGKAL
jgi:ribosomal protein S18 acetylase RimI-like enzyme